MTDITPTRHTDEPPTRDGAPLAGWPTVITAEEATALQTALAQLQTALDAVTRDRDEARAEVERLAREHAAEWRPIETAPRDGTTILVYFRQHGAMTVRSDDEHDPCDDWRLWYVDDHKHGPYVVRGYRPGDDTHWMPLPQPPKALEAKS